MSQTPFSTVDLVVNESFSVKGEPSGQLFGEISTLCNISFSSSSAIRENNNHCLTINIPFITQPIKF